MKMSSRKTMLTAAVLVTLSSGTTYAATPETVDSQDLFHANRLVTDPAKNPAVEETSVGDQYEASISGQKKTSSSAQAPETSTQVKPARLRWESVDARLAARNNEPSFNLSAQKAKPVIITAEDIRREEKLAAKEGRPVRELVGDVNMNRPIPPPRPKKSTSHTEAESYVNGAAASTSTNAMSSTDHPRSAQASVASNEMYRTPSGSGRQMSEQAAVASGQAYAPFNAQHTDQQAPGSTQHGYISQTAPNTVTSSNTPSPDIMQQAERMAQTPSSGSGRQMSEQAAVASGQAYAPFNAQHTDQQAPGSTQHGYISQTAPNTVTSSNTPSPDIMQQAERMAQTPSSGSGRQMSEQVAVASGQAYASFNAQHTDQQTPGSAQHGYVSQTAPNTITSSNTPSPDIMQQAERMAQTPSSTLPSATVSSAGAVAEVEQRPSRSHYSQLPHEEFSLTPAAENGAAPRQPEKFEALGGMPAQRPIAPAVKDVAPAVERSVRPEGVPALSPRQVTQNNVDDLAGISDEVRRHILAGQLAMEVQLQRDPSVAGMRAITKVLRENTTLTRLQKIDFLIGFGRALHRSGLPRQQEALLIKTIAESF